MSAESETYRVPLVCNNCGLERPVSLPRGEVRSACVLCPTCGCVAAHHEKLPEWRR